MRRSSSQSGFTLVEMLVSLALFSVVISMSVGSLLVLIGANASARNMQIVMTNLSFALDSMTRDIRTGYNYYCDSVAGLNASIPDEDQRRDCSLGGTRLMFVEGGTSLTNCGACGGTNDQRVTYFYRQDDGIGTIYRRLGTAPAAAMTSPEIDIEELQFVVTGANDSLFDGSGDDEQPTVTIFVRGFAGDVNRPEEQAEFAMQTTVTQRRLDL